MTGTLCNNCESLHLGSLFNVGITDVSSSRGGKKVGSCQVSSLRQHADCQFCRLLLSLIETTKAFSTASEPEKISFDLYLYNAYSYQLEIEPWTLIAIPWLCIEPQGRLDRHPSDELKDPAAQSVVIQRLLPGGPELFGEKSSYGWGRQIGRIADVTLLRSWLRLCCSEHPTCAPVRTPAGVPDLLIDVVRNCVVHAPAENRYVALSYVWGDGSKQLKLTDETKARLMSPDGLAVTWPDVPKTIRHAMQLCRALDVPFLWVDALCINQGPTRDAKKATWSGDITKGMQYIYRGALFTIVAAAGKDCWAGLPAFAGERRSEQCTANVDGLLLAGSVYDSPHCTRHSTWNSRAWTLQERVLSKRFMIFTEDRVVWECSEPYPEDIHLERHPDTWKSSTSFGSFSYEMGFLEETHHTGRFGGFLNLLRDFTSRQLSFQEDSLAAIDGVLSLVGEKLNTDFLWGLPTSYLELAVLFNVGCYDPSTRRRGFPSWTWAGWNQPIQPGTAALCFAGWVHAGFMAFPDIFNDEYQPIATCFRPTKGSLIGGRDTIQFELVQGMARAEPATASRTATLSMELAAQCKDRFAHILLVSSTVASLRLSATPVHNPSLDSTMTYYILLPFEENEASQSRRIGQVALDADWRMAQPNEFDFIAIGKERTGKGTTYIHTLMVRMVGKSMAERIQAVMFLEEDWNGAQPQARMMCLI